MNELPHHDAAATPDAPGTGPDERHDDDDDDEPRVRRLIELEALLDEVRTRAPRAPHWELCEGFLAALLCSRRAISAHEFLPVLLGGDAAAAAPEQTDAAAPFADAAQRDRFLRLWQERSAEVERELQAALAAPDADEPHYWPQVSDLRALVARLPADERAAFDGSADVPAFAQLWAIGFMDAVDAWPEEWAPPRDRDTRAALEDAILAIDALVEDDTAPPEVAPFDDADPPSVSARRFEQFNEALWAVQDLHQIWRALGPRTLPLRKPAAPGRNDPCWCGSGRKFKKCHGG